MYQHIQVPEGGQKITVNADMSLNVPDEPIIPFIEGDGTGLDITPVMLKVVDAAVAKSYGGKRKIHWMEVYAGEKSTQLYGPDEWFPKETFDALIARHAEDEEARDRVLPGLADQLGELAGLTRFALNPDNEELAAELAQQLAPPPPQANQKQAECP